MHPPCVTCWHSLGSERGRRLELNLRRAPAGHALRCCPLPPLEGGHRHARHAVVSFKVEAAMTEAAARTSGPRHQRRGVRQTAKDALVRLPCGTATHHAADVEAVSHCVLPLSVVALSRLPDDAAVHWSRRTRAEHWGQGPCQHREQVSGNRLPRIHPLYPDTYTLSPIASGRASWWRRVLSTSSAPPRPGGQQSRASRCPRQARTCSPPRRGGWSAGARSCG